MQNFGVTNKEHYGIYVMVFLEWSICVEGLGLLFDSVIILLFSQPIVWAVGMPRIPLDHAENFRKCIDVKLRACLHGDGVPQVGEVTRLGGVTRLSI